MANRSDNFYSESALLKLQDGKEYRKKLYSETQVVLANMLDVLPSVYSATTSSTNYGSHLKRVATEIARLKIEADNIQKDASIDTVRPEYLYQKFGYQIQVNNTFFPTTDFGDETYRKFLKAVLYVIFNGSSLENITTAVQIFTDYPVTVTDTTSRRGVIQYSYLATFHNNILRLNGNLDNISKIRLSDPSDFVVYQLGPDYYDATPNLREQVQIKRQTSGTIPLYTPVRVQYEYRDSIVDQFKLKFSFILSEVQDPKKAEDLIQKISFLLHLIKPAHVLPEIYVYETDNVKKEADLFVQSTEEDVYLGLDATTERRFITHSYDDFRRFTRNQSDTVVLEFNNEEHVFNKISEGYDDIGYYIGEADPLYRKKYKLFQLKGFSAQSSSILNLPYTLEFNQPQRSLLNNISYFDQTQSIKDVQFPIVEPNTDLPVKDFSDSSPDLLVSALSLDFGVSVASGTLYTYQLGRIVSLPSPQEIILPEEAKGTRTYIFINLESEPTLDYQVTLYGNLDLEIPYIALAYVDIPEDALILWDHYITDLRMYYFTNLTLRGDTSGFSDFNVSQGIVLGLGTRPIQYKFDDAQSNEIYNFEKLNELNSLGMSLNSNFELGLQATSYRADDLNFLYTGLEAETQETQLGSIATPIQDNGFIITVSSPDLNGADTFDPPTEATLFDFELPTSDTAAAAQDGSATLSINFFNDDVFGIPGFGLLFNDAVLATGTQLVYSWPSGDLLLLNEFDSVLNPELVESFVDVTIFNEDLSGLLNQTYLGTIEQIILEETSIIDQSTGLPVVDINGNPVT